MSTQVATIIDAGKPFLVGEWLVEPSLNRLTRGDLTIQLELKAMDVLLCLVEHAGELVPKHVLLDTVWQTEFVADNTVQRRIADLRGAFGDDVQNPRFIETIRKRGYRLIAEVRLVPRDGRAPPPIPEAHALPEDEHNPYPGLAAFTEADANCFFGREAESAALWRKVTSRRLLALIGPSGVGKSSLVRAGLAARVPPGWRVVVFTPGETPALSLARALLPDHTGDPAAMARLLGFSDADTALAVVSRWRDQFDEAVLVVDQFEELFTLNPPEAQASFIELLRRLVDAADIHVVLAMRDDYLCRCNEFEQIAPIFEALTPLAPPAAEGLRRALKEPAARQLYRFETELLVDRMIAEADGERGALPLMAFAIHRLWEERDREQRVLTEEAYEGIGGVAGALAKHAEATLERIGSERLPIVRELFRNLMAAEGTRAVREVDELLSVFSDGSESSLPGDRPPARRKAEEVLQQLVDARLLTSYRHGDEDGAVRRVEIIHESLLASWPRLVRWQTQDADGALLRDQLRQAARTWAERERSNDLLWAGSAYREYVLWRERYPGGLTDLEEEFATAMTSLATRRRRRRRTAGGVAFAVLLAVLAVVGLLWQRSVREIRRAEAANLLALGQIQFEDDPTAALAHAIASLELVDSAGARRLALRALWEGPTAIIVNEDESAQVDFAGDGDWLVQGMQTLGHDGHLRVVFKDGSNTRFERVHSSPLVKVDMSPEGGVMYSAPMVEAGTPENVVLWSLPDGRRLSETWFEPPAYIRSSAGGSSWSPNRVVMLVREGDQSSVYAFGFDGTTERLGTLDYDHPPGPSGPRAMGRRSGRRIAALQGDRLVLIEIGEHGLLDSRVLGRHQGTGHRLAFDPDGRLVATASSDGQIKIWDPEGTAPLMEVEGPPNIDYLEVSSHASRLEAYAVEEGNLVAWVWSLKRESARLLRRFSCGPEHGFSPSFNTMGWDSSRRLFAKCGPGKTIQLWSLSAPSDADPIFLRRGAVVSYSNGQSFHPSGRWLAVAQIPGLTLWPLSRPYPWVIRAHSNTVSSVAFGPGGAWIASGSESGVVRLTPLAGEVPESTSFVHDGLGMVRALAASSDGTRLLVGRDYRGAAIIPLDGTSASKLGALIHVSGVSFSSDGRQAAAAGREDDGVVKLHVFGTDTLEQEAVLKPDSKGANLFLDKRHGFLPDGRVLSAGFSGLWAWDPATGDSEHLFEGVCAEFAASADGRRIVLVARATQDSRSPSRVVLLDLDTGTQTHLANYGDQVWSIAMNAEATTIVTGDYDGVVRVGLTDGSEPHLLLGHNGWVASVDMDPLGRWVASGSEDTTFRIWPMPDLSKPPLHTLPHDELLAKLKSLTNLRVVRDNNSSTGWTLTHEPFPGWETVPDW